MTLYKKQGAKKKDGKRDYIRFEDGCNYANSFNGAHYGNGGGDHTIAVKEACSKEP